MSPKIALIVATYEREAPLARLLGWLERQDLAASDWELVVAVDGSKDGSLALLERHAGRGRLPLTYFHQENTGPAGARDAAIRRARAPRIAVLDDDMEVGPDFLRRHLAAADAAPERVVVLGRIKGVDGWRAKPVFAALQEADLEALHAAYAEGRMRPSWLGFFTGNVSFPRALYLEVGGFDHAFRMDEDRELGWRLQRGGGQFVFAADAAGVHHSEGGRYEPWLRRQQQYGIYAVKLWEKHGRAPEVHPLRFFVEKGPLTRLVVSLLVRVDPLAQVFVGAMRWLGEGLRAVGCFGAALATYKAIRVVQFHRGVRDGVGSTDALRAVGRGYREGGGP
jgi:GT2 family glycosyltransferase